MDCSTNGIGASRPSVVMTANDNAAGSSGAISTLDEENPAKM